jgi:molybdate transport system substrate-binding protein
MTNDREMRLVQNCLQLLRVIFFIILLSGIGMNAIADDAPVVAVAANFSPALAEIIKEFTAHTGQEIRISTGATGTLVRQIEQGAPFELFLSADEEHIAYLQDKGFAQDGGRVYAIGILVLYLPHTTRLNITANNADILKQLYSQKQVRVAIANPELAPYGYAAKQVLQRFGQWHMVQDRVVLGENVGQAAQFALSGSVDAALLPYALALDPGMQASGQFRIIAADWYAPIRQRMALLKNAGKATTEFYAYLSSETAQQIIHKYGYALP